ncbi:YitT family protein [Ectobacillus panaciterrae]|uniref:YitT family protein n=1 Tax=Ectobacillus panaciterrae TaxID=363872 RepID=UPI0003FCB67C|nr:YitT family protein [Ectobacillus panaciterrae]
MARLGDADYVPETPFLHVAASKTRYIELIVQLTVILIASALYAVSMNMFFIPHNMISGGFAGVGMIIGYLTHYDIGTLIFLLNLPLFGLSYKYLGKKITFLTAYFITFSTIAMAIVPVQQLSHDILLSSVFGGILCGGATGIVFRFAASTGGFDVIGLLVARYWDISIGAVIFVFNCLLLIIAGFMFGWDITLYTFISRFVVSKVIDGIHTKHIKLTVMIVTEKGMAVKQALLNQCIRGVTMVDAVGAYTDHQKKVIYTVITRYELGEVKRLVRQVDSYAFMNITETVEVVGRFKRI